MAPPRLQTVRGYGLYGARQRTALDQARNSLGQPPVEDPLPLEPERFLARFPRQPTTACCPRCNALLVFHSALPRGPGPPQTLH